MIQKDISLFKKILINALPIILSFILILMFDKNYKIIMMILAALYGVCAVLSLISCRFKKIDMSIGITRRQINYKYTKTELLLLVFSIVFNVINCLFACLIYKENIFIDLELIEKLILIIMFSLIIANMILLIINIYANKLTFSVIITTSIVLVTGLIYLYVVNYIYLLLILMIFMNIFITLINRRIIFKQNI